MSENLIKKLNFKMQNLELISFVNAKLGNIVTFIGLSVKVSTFGRKLARVATKIIKDFGRALCKEFTIIQ